jgi:E3 ubiquitin-protein ligase LRSAM1
MELMGDKRETLAKLLLDLMEKKQQRADDLQKMMKDMETGKEEEQENYWLIQYQKLLDSKPKGLEKAENNLDTKV